MYNGVSLGLRYGQKVEWFRSNVTSKPWTISNC